MVTEKLTLCVQWCDMGEDRSILLMSDRDCNMNLYIAEIENIRDDNEDPLFESRYYSPTIGHYRKIVWASTLEEAKKQTLQNLRYIGPTQQHERDK